MFLLRAMIINNKLKIKITIMAKNCWEWKNCRRIEGGEKVAELGVCTAFTAGKLDGINHGKNGGRCCWAIEKTLCQDKVQGSFIQKMRECNNCEFFKKVATEEGPKLTSTTEILNKLKE